ncbi:PA2779 family protein [Pseudobacteriovorax antillogorgiicola]|uniref:PA2779 family protein n=1 Tax=Pseudobacteriovorax antillogorgiicola TaxID=1513793 RepID=A0A1Y6BY05_9BACT|nr:PA2779 family protein [Pseudobacteriovorax antillogorgiicola]TCS53014.1 hypothetical protein EDD56_10865 [Pseudobacteriovorax antillogorgiicola]SMF26945.1 hypothetical protein SAMN06296036_108182 [Pseudobacteriovorax antillogorgiicola]
MVVDIKRKIIATSLSCFVLFSPLGMAKTNGVPDQTKDRVVEYLVDSGVSAKEAKQRVRYLSPEELSELEEKSMEEVPAGQDTVVMSVTTAILLGILLILL